MYKASLFPNDELVLFTELLSARKNYAIALFSLIQIWDYHSGTLVDTLKENISTVCSHPELPVLITGSNDGRVLVWTTSTFRYVVLVFLVMS